MKSAVSMANTTTSLQSRVLTAEPIVKFAIMRPVARTATMATTFGTTQSAVPLAPITTPNPAVARTVEPIVMHAIARRIACIVKVVTRNRMVGAVVLGRFTVQQRLLVKNADDIAFTAPTKPTVRNAWRVSMPPLEGAVSMAPTTAWIALYVSIVRPTVLLA